MLALEQQARSFFLRCRARSVQCRRPRSVRNNDHVPTRTFSSSRLAASYNPADTPPNKPYYVTSPIFYVNAAPHAGHLYTLILTDVLKRWHHLKGDHGASLLTGTDEHGMKIQKAADRAKTEVKVFCDQHAVQFKQLCDNASISYDRFIRTTDEDHKEAVQFFWRRLNENGYLYEAKHEGWYSVSDETFYPESQTHLVLEPSSGRKMRASKETGKEVEWTSETNYHFKLSAFKDELLRHYKENPDFIIPQQRMNYIVKEVESGLSDLSVSRPSSRLPWGVRVPDDDSQTIYVWLDALINYLTATGWPYETGKHKLWPPNCQVIGKDIIRFHCVYWPAFLMALALPLPKQFLSHAHWTMNDEKMSKSAGNGVNPFYAMERFGVDAMRFYMIHDGGIVDDADYENSYIIEKYKKFLQGQFGNLISRVVRSKKWNLRECVSFMESDYHTWETWSDMSGTIKTHFSYLTNTVAKADESMKEVNPRQAVQSIVRTIYNTNKYFQDMAVWDLADSPVESRQTELKRIIWITAESIRISAILLSPFMPEKMHRALDMLGVSKDRRDWNYTQPGSDFEYGVPLVDIGKAGQEGTLFPPLISEY